MISGGAAFTFAMLAFIAGYVVGSLVEGGRRARRPAHRPEGRQASLAANMAIHRSMTLEEASEAVMRAYKGAHVRYDDIPPNPRPGPKPPYDQSIHA